MLLDDLVLLRHKIEAQSMTDSILLAGKLNNKFLIRPASSEYSQRHGVPIQIPELGAIRRVNWFRYIIKLHGKHHHCVVG